MSNDNVNNKRIIKNSFFLYIRTFVVAIISLFTVRETLQILGAEDFGIYNIVASFVLMFSFMSGTMISATQRFFSFSLGRRDDDGYRDYFSISLWIFFVISLVAVVAGESIGVWAIGNYLTIPVERVPAATIVLHFSLVTLLFNMLAIPYTSSIVAHEKMNAFAYISIVDGVTKLLLVYLLLCVDVDKLSLYGALMAVQSIVIFLSYFIYCRINFSVCRFSWRLGRDGRGMLREFAGYTGWNIFGSATGMLNTQGQNVLLNIFFNPLVNSAKAIADRVNILISTFVSNVYTAVSPQIVKSYAAGEFEPMYRLAIASSKYMFCVFYTVVCAMLLSVVEMLQLWLGEGSVDGDMIIFTQLVLVYSLVNLLEPPLTYMVRATGDIKRYQISVGIVTLMFVPLSALFLVLGEPAYTTMLVLIGLYIVAHYVRMRIVERQVGLSIRRYVVEVLYPIVKLVLVSLPLYWAVGQIDVGAVFFNLVLRSLSICVLLVGVIYFVVLSSDERGAVVGFLRRRFRGEIER